MQWGKTGNGYSAGQRNPTVAAMKIAVAIGVAQGNNAVDAGELKGTDRVGLVPLRYTGPSLHRCAQQQRLKN